MRYHPLGSTDLKVSAVSFGTAPLGDMFGAADETEATNAIHRALDAGITFFDSSPYYGNGLAERRLGTALRGRRDDVVIGTKAGRYGSEFDFTPKRLRESIHHSLELLQTDHVDILQLHDIEFTDLDGVFGDTYAELARLRDEGKCRYIGMTGFPMETLRRAVAETDLDVVLSYAHYTLLNTRLADELVPLCRERGVGLINAAAVALGLLTPAGSRIAVPAGQQIVDAARRAGEVCAERGADIAFLANQFSIQRSGAATTVVGTTKARHLDAAVAAEAAPIDEDLLTAVLAATVDVRDLSWSSGLPENNGGDTCSA